MPLSDKQHDDDEGYSQEVVQRILAAKYEGLVSDKAYHELRMALPWKVRSHVPPLSAIKQESRTQYKEIKVVQIPEVNNFLENKTIHIPLLAFAEQTLSKVEVRVERVMKSIQKPCSFPWMRVGKIMAADTT